MVFADVPRTTLKAVRLPPLVVISGHGPFLMKDAGGNDCAPRSQRARAAIVLIGLAPNQIRGRRWLEEHLWSTREAKQASGSLRQALSEIRKSLGYNAEIIQSDRRSIWFAPDTVSVSLDESLGDFLEDTHVNDPAFKNWKALQSAPGGKATHAASGSLILAALPVDDALNIRCMTSQNAGTGAAILGEIVAQQVGDGLAHQIRSHRMSGDLPVAAQTSGLDIEVDCNVVEDNGFCVVFIKVVHPASGRLLFSKSFRAEGPASTLVDKIDVAQTVFEASEQTLGNLPVALTTETASTRAAALGRLAVQKIFSFEPQALQEADRLLEQAYSTDQSALFMAWRGLLQMILSIELASGKIPILYDKANEFVEIATQNANNNPRVQSLVALTRVMMFGDQYGALAAAEKAAIASPQDPFALQALAVSKMLAGAYEEAFELSSQSQLIASRSRFGQWWNLHHCTVSVAAGRMDAALAAGEMAVSNAPALRAVQRHLIVAYASLDDLENAERVSKRLAKIEPGFSLDRLLRDTDYPVRTMRNVGVLSSVSKLL